MAELPDLDVICLVDRELNGSYEYRVRTPCCGFVQEVPGTVVSLSWLRRGRLPVTCERCARRIVVQSPEPYPYTIFPIDLMPIPFVPCCAAGAGPPGKIVTYSGGCVRGAKRLTVQCHKCRQWRGVPALPPDTGA